tara:strand:+ start:360 stop:677 length:318 start_codon:yes stop_codon:yes gene_type:complete
MAKNLWFNQDGEGDDTNGEFVDTITGDEIDKFSKTGDIALSHSFDEKGVPEEVNIQFRVEECEFLQTELDDSYTELNFAATQGEIDEIYKKIELLEAVLGETNCN